LIFLWEKNMSANPKYAADVAEIVAATRQHVGEACVTAASSLIAGVGNDFTSTFAVVPIATILPKLNTLLAMAREFSNILEPVVPRIEAVVRLLGHESELKIWSRKERMLDLGCLLAEYATEVLVVPCESHARSLYFQALALRCLRNTEAYSSVTDELERIAETEGEPWRAVYLARLKLLDAERFRRADVRRRDLERAREANREVLALADLLDRYPSLEIPGMRRAALGNLFFIEVAAERWDAAAAAWEADCGRFVDCRGGPAVLLRVSAACRGLGAVENRSAG
jgi:hypothetical protein